MKRRPQNYIALTLFKQDIRELVQIFQNNLQNVFFVIDGRRILDGAQLEQFDPTYQATSLVARGYYREVKEDQFVLLAVHKRGAMLQLPGGDTVWKEEFEVVGRIEEVFSRCQNPVLQFFDGKEFASFLILPFVFLSELQYHHVNYLVQIFVSMGSILLLIPFALVVLRLLKRWLRVETRVFLFPGGMRTARMYGLYETAGRWVISLVLSIAFIVIFFIVFHMFW